MPTTDESGLRRTSVYWVPEVEAADGTPETPAEPEFKLWSRSINNESGESSAEYYESLGIGDYVPVDKHHSVESHERTINYDMYRFPVDASGNANSPLYYAAKRDIDNQLPATLSHLKVVERDSIVKNSTVHYEYFTELGNSHPSGTDPGATAGKASRQEIYGRGGRPDEVVPNANPSDAALVTIEATMLFGKVRSYQIDQPNSEYINIRSTASEDTNVTVEIAPVGGTIEQLSTDGTDGQSSVGSSSTYDSLRVRVPDEHVGTIEIYGDDGSGTDAAGNPEELLAYIPGTNTYDGIDYDTGVPLTGANGSFEQPSALPADGVSAVTTAGEWDGHDAAQKILGTEISIANNAEAMEPAGTFEADIQVGTQETELTCNVYGETESTDKFGDHITGREGELRIPTSKGDFVFPRAYVSSPGEPEQEAGTAVMEVEVGFRILTPTDGSDPVEFVHASNR